MAWYSFFGNTTVFGHDSMAWDTDRWTATWNAEPNGPYNYRYLHLIFPDFGDSVHWPASQIRLTFKVTTATPQYFSQIRAAVGVYDYNFVYKEGVYSEGSGATKADIIASSDCNTTIQIVVPFTVDPWWPTAVAVYVEPLSSYEDYPSVTLEITNLEADIEFPQPLHISGTITEDSDIDDFYLLGWALGGNGGPIGMLSVQAGNYTFLTEGHAEPCYLIVIPKVNRAWAPNGYFYEGENCIPTDPVTTPYLYAPSTTGVGGDLEPTWPTTKGQTVVDGDIAWTCLGRLPEPQAQGPIIPGS